MAWALVQLILNRHGLSCPHRRLWLEKVAGQVGRGCFDAPQCFVTLVWSWLLPASAADDSAFPFSSDRP